MITVMETQNKSQIVSRLLLRSKTLVMNLIASNNIWFRYKLRYCVVTCKTSLGNGQERGFFYVCPRYQGKNCLHRHITC